MSEEHSGLYARRVGIPRTSDEVRGYWLFVVGLLAGIIGIALFLPSTPASALREASIAFSGVGLALLVAGPVIRLPLRRMATYTTYLGLAVCLLAVVWFLLAFPAGWSVETGNAGVISLYAVGIAIIGIGGILIPLLTGSTAAVDERAAELEREREERESAATVAEERDRLQAELDSLRQSQGQFELYEDSSDEWRWRLRHRNGNVIASSGEGYTRKHNAQKGLQSVRANALGAAVLDTETVPDEEEVPILPELAETSDASFEVYEDKGGEFRWRLVHDNGNILADSGEGYTRRRDAKRAIESVQRNAAPATYLKFDPTSFEIYRDEAGEWRWRLVHKNGNILADSSEGYTRRRNARRAVDSLREGVDDADIEA